MTLVEVFDALCGKRVTRIDFKDGTHLTGPQPMLIDLHDADTLADAWIEGSEEGLVLHFNAKPYPGADLQGQTELLSNIASVV